MEIILRSNDNVIEIKDLKNKATGSYLNSATVTFTLKDSSGNTVSGADTVSMTYVSSSDGVYRGTLADTVSLTQNALYTCEITINAGAGLQGFIITSAIARDRHAAS